MVNAVGPKLFKLAALKSFELEPEIISALY